jgi:hypothetical protein
VRDDACEAVFSDNQNAGDGEEPAQHHDLEGVGEETSDGWVDKRGDQQRDDATDTKECGNDPDHLAHVDLESTGQFEVAFYNHPWETYPCAGSVLERLLNGNRVDILKRIAWLCVWPASVGPSSVDRDCETGL